LDDQLTNGRDGIETFICLIRTQVRHSVTSTLITVLSLSSTMSRLAHCITPAGTLRCELWATLQDLLVPHLRHMEFFRPRLVNAQRQLAVWQEDLLAPPLVLLSELPSCPAQAL
jgi:hypothetical protein